MLVQLTSGLDYKICKLKENQKGKNICIDSDFVEFHTGMLSPSGGKGHMCSEEGLKRKHCCIVIILRTDSEHAGIHYGEPMKTLVSS